MTYNRQLIPIAALIAAIALGAYFANTLDAQAPTVIGDFSNATVAEVRDSQGQVVLRGQFETMEDDDDDLERKATPAPAGSDTDAAGEAEVETSKGSPAEQEIEFSLRNVEPGTAFTFVIDGQDVGHATADTRGRAEIEIRAALSSGSGSR
jgi:hypothetical protein